MAGPTMAYRYGAVRQYVNCFQPSFKLVEKTRHRSRAVGIDPRRPVAVRRHLQDHGRVPEQWEVVSAACVGTAVNLVAGGYITPTNP